MNDERSAMVFIVDDDDAVRDSITELVESIGLSAESYASPLSFLEAYDPDRPGCLVLDVRMAEMSGLALQKHLTDIDATLPVIMLTGHGDVPMAVEAIKNGALDFIQKPYREQTLLDSINSALSKNDADRRSADSNDELQDRLAALTEREREVFELLQYGKSSKLIARELEISPRTVETHRHHVLSKLGVSSVKDLMLLLASRQSGD